MDTFPRSPKTSAHTGWHLRSPEVAAEWELFTFPRLSAQNHSTTSSRPVRSVKMSATGTGGCGPGPGPTSGSGSGASNPRKFSEKIALHTQRQAEETAAFQEVMMDITSTRVSLRRRQEEESCPEEERPCLGLSGSKIALSAASTWRSAQNWCVHGE